MTLAANEITLINEIISAKDWIRVINLIEFSTTDSTYNGSIEINTSKGIIEIDVVIEQNFPLSKIHFKCKNIRGYEHEMYDGSLCLNASPSKSLAGRLELELEKLKIWVDDYFVNEKQDEHFEYYQFYKNKLIPLVFEEDESKPELKGTCGKFNYGLLNKQEFGEIIFNSWIAINLGGRKCRWSRSFENVIAGNYHGLWVYIETQPVIQKRETISNWIELINLLSPSQLRFIYDESKSLKKTSGYKEAFFLMLGYKIPNGDKHEIHWETILIDFNNFPYAPKKLSSGNYVAVDLGKKIVWCQSSNASYKRLFGRGKLSDKLTESKILVIGCGAIGSSVIMSLVRGGAKNITINDGDSIEPGNICRGQFFFRDSFFPKMKELEIEAISASPYVQISGGFKVEPIRENDENYNGLQKILMNYDFIFDCSTDKYLSIMLDSMELRGTIINLSISNQANHLVAITGNGNIHLAKSNLYNKISPGSAEPVFIATGCWHPTFQASYSEINVLLSYALNEINLRIEENQSIISFVITKKITELKSLEYSLRYNV